MYCVHCGAQVDETMRFCPQCGKSLDPSSFQTPPCGAESPLDGYNANPYGCGCSYDRSPCYDRATGPINDFLLWNILATLFCCMPCGLAGLVFSFLCSSAKTRGDVETARSRATIAQVLFWISLIGGVVIYVVYACFLVLGSVTNSWLL